MPRHILRTSLAFALIGGTLLPALPAVTAAPAGKPSMKASERLLTHDTCMRVVEGDLIEGQKVGLIRLVGVIAPTQGEAGYREAIDYTRKLAMGKQIKLEICGKRPNDFRQRLRAVVYLPDGTNLNTKLLRAGMARVLEHQPCHLDANAWKPYETGAQQAKMGIWAAAAGQPGPAQQPQGVTRKAGEEGTRPRAEVKRAAAVKTPASAGRTAGKRSGSHVIIRPHQ